MAINIPEGYQQVMVYLILDQPERFLDFTQKVFGATEKMKHLGDNQELLHAEIQIGGCCIMIGGANSQFPPMTAGLFVYVENADQSFEQAQAAGATVVMGLSDQPYGRTCGVKDPTGNTWWITSV